MVFVFVRVEFVQCYGSGFGTVSVLLQKANSLKSYCRYHSMTIVMSGIFFFLIRGAGCRGLMLAGSSTCSIWFKLNVSSEKQWINPRRHPRKDTWLYSKKKRGKAHSHSMIHCKIEDISEKKSDDVILLLLESKKLNVTP